MPIASSPRERAAAALAALGVVAGITAALVIGLRPHWQAAIRSVLVAVDVAAPAPSPTPPPPPPPRPATDSAPKGSPAPRNLEGKASAVFAPPIAVPLVMPPPMVTAPLPALGNAAQSGASDLAGPGTGAGGIGNGTGSGRNGGNDSGGSPPAVGPLQIRGKLAYRDLPQGLVAPGAEAGVGLRYTVNIDGSVSNCRIDRTSGFAALDQAACRLIEARFRFRPARDAQRRPVPSTVAEDHVWVRAPDED